MLTYEEKLNRLRTIDEQQGDAYRRKFLMGQITHEALHRTTEVFMLQSLKAELLFKVGKEATR